MKRRGFLGFVGGAAVAGPTVAKNAVAQLPSGLGFSAGAIGYGSNAIPPTGLSGGDWRLEEIARLKRFITGELTDEEKQEERAGMLRSHESLISQHAASLVSVSPVRKISIFNREMRKLSREIDVIYRSGQLARMLNELK